MKSITVNGSQRESVGKVATKALRNAGKVPCVLYGGEKPIHFSADELEFKVLTHTSKAHTAVIDLGAKTKFNAVLQDIQFHPVTDKILHIDFYQLSDDKEITMDIPMKIVGNAPGVILGGTLHVNKRKLRVKALPANLPDFIEVDISGLNIGNKLYINALDSDNFEFMHPENTVVVQVRRSRASITATKGEEEVTATSEKSEGK